MGKIVNVDPDEVAAFNRQLMGAQESLLEVINTIVGCKSVTEWNDDNRKKFDEMMDQVLETLGDCLREMGDTICDLRNISEKANNIRLK